MILSHFSGAAVPFWWCSQVRVAKMVFMAVVNYQTQCRRRHRRQKRILKAVLLLTAAIRRQWVWGWSLGQVALGRGGTIYEVNYQRKKQSGRPRGGLAIHPGQGAVGKKLKQANLIFSSCSLPTPPLVPLMAEIPARSICIL